MNRALNLDKRRTLKILSGTTVIGVMASMPAIALADSDQSIADSTLDCKLISRADISRAHLLMHNKSNVEVVVTGFKSQKMEYDDTLLNLSKAYTKAVIVPANDKVMIRLNTKIEPEHPSKGDGIIDMRTQYLPQGTRVVELKLLIKNGVAEIDKNTVFS